MTKTPYFLIFNYNLWLIVAFSLFTRFFFNNYFFIDLFYRIDANDNLLNFYSFFWTNLWYLIIFLSAIYIFIILINFAYSVNVVSLLLLFLFLYIYELWDFSSSNNSMYFINLSFYNINPFLMNNINKYHPFIFYYSFWFIGFIFYSIIYYFYSVKCTFKSSHVTLKLVTVSFWIVFLNSYALFLGSWWAIQEGTWGGWWGWDPSEVFGLLFLFISLYYLHIKINSFVGLLYFYLYHISLIVVVYYFIQLNFDLVSHNFGTHFFFFFNNNFFFLELIIVLFAFLFLLLNVLNNFFLKYLSFKLITGQPKVTFLLANLIRVVFILLFVYLLNYSFSFIFNFFIFNFFNLNTLNSIFLNNKYIYLFTFLFNYLIFRVNFNLFLITIPFSFFISPIPYFILLLSTFIGETLVIFLHWTILLFFLASACSFYITFSNWSINTYFGSAFLLKKPLVFSVLLKSISSFSVELDFLFFNGFLSKISAFSIYFFNKLNSLNSFSYFMLNWKLNSLLVLNNNPFFLYISIDLFFEYLLLPIYLISLFLIIFFKKKLVNNQF